MARYLFEIKKRNDPFSYQDEYYLSLMLRGEEIVMDFYISKSLNIDYDLYNDLKNKYNAEYNHYDCISYFKRLTDIINFQNELWDIAILNIKNL